MLAGFLSDQTNVVSAISADLAKVKTKNIRSAQDIMMAERPADGAEHISGSFVAILPPMFRGMREHAERC